MKLIYDEWLGRYLLYNLADDPGEKKDLSREMPGVVEELANWLQNWRKMQLDYYGDVARQAKEYPPVLDAS